MNKQLDAQSYGIGQPVRRVEDARFLTGRGHFVDDLELPHQAHAVVVLSPHAHARIRRIDAGAARTAPGVICVLTGADAKEDRLSGLPPNFMPEDIGGPKGLRTRRPILVADRVRCHLQLFHQAADDIFLEPRHADYQLAVLHFDAHERSRSANRPVHVVEAHRSRRPRVRRRRRF